MDHTVHVVNANNYYDIYNHQSVKISDVSADLIQSENNVQSHIYDPSQFYYDDEYDAINNDISNLQLNSEDQIGKHIEKDKVKKNYTNECDAEERKQNNEFYDEKKRKENKDFNLNKTIENRSRESMSEKIYENEEIKNTNTYIQRKDDKNLLEEKSIDDKKEKEIKDFRNVRKKQSVMNRRKKQNEKELRVDSDEDYDFDKDVREGNYEESDEDIIGEKENVEVKTGISHKEYIKNIFEEKKDSDHEMIDNVSSVKQKTVDVNEESSGSSNESESDIEYDFEEEEEYVNEDYYIVDSSDDDGIEEYVRQSIGKNVSTNDRDHCNDNIKQKESLEDRVLVKNRISLEANNSKEEQFYDERDKIKNCSIETLLEKSQGYNDNIHKSYVQLFNPRLEEPNSHSFLDKNSKDKKKKRYKECFLGFSGDIKELHRIDVKTQILLHQIRNVQKKLNSKDDEDYLIENGIEDGVDFTQYDRKFFDNDLKFIFSYNGTKKIKIKTEKTSPVDHRGENNYSLGKVQSKNNKYEIIKRKRNTSKYDAFIEEIRIYDEPIKKRKRGRPKKNKKYKTLQPFEIRQQILLMKALDEELKRFHQFVQNEKDRIDQGLDYQCSVCYQIFEQNTNLKKHFYKCLNKYTQTQIKTPFKCVICGEYFPFLNFLEKHINEKHIIDASDKTYQCGHCSTCYLTKDLLFDHFISNHEIIQCIYCDRYYKTQQDLNDHINKKHNIKIEELEIAEKNEEINRSESLPIIKRGRGRPKKNSIQSNCLILQIKEENNEGVDQTKEESNSAVKDERTEQQQTNDENPVHKDKIQTVLSQVDESRHIIEQHQMADKIKKEEIKINMNILENKIVQVRGRGRPKLEAKSRKKSKSTIKNRSKINEVPSSLYIKQEFNSETNSDTQMKNCKIFPKNAECQDIDVNKVNDNITNISNPDVDTNINIENKSDSKIKLEGQNIVVKAEKEENIPNININEFGRGRRVKKPKLIDYDETIAGITIRKRKISDDLTEQNHQGAKKIKIDESLMIASIIVNAIKNNNKKGEIVDISRTKRNTENDYKRIYDKDIKKDRTKKKKKKIRQKQISCLKCNKVFRNNVLLRKHKIRFHSSNNINFNEQNLKQHEKYKSDNQRKKRTTDKMDSNEIKQQRNDRGEIDDTIIKRTQLENKLRIRNLEKNKLEETSSKMSIRNQNSTGKLNLKSSKNINGNSTEKSDLKSMENTNQRSAEKRNRNSTEKFNLYSLEKRNLNLMEKVNLNTSVKRNLNSIEKLNISDKKDLNDQEKGNHNNVPKRNLNSTEKTVKIHQSSETIKQTKQINVQVNEKKDDDESIDRTKSVILYESLSKRYSPKNYPSLPNRDKSFFKCFFCPVQYLRHSQLDRHFISHHNGYPCYVCHTLLISRQSLERHLFASHKEYERYKCCVCFKFMKSKQTLRKHFYMHEDRRPYTCKVCKTSFRYSYDMRLHMNRTHFKILNSVNRGEECVEPV